MLLEAQKHAYGHVGDLTYIRTCVLISMGRHSLREDILDAGLELMFREGYQAATVRDIWRSPNSRVTRGHLTYLPLDLN